MQTAADILGQAKSHRGRSPHRAGTIIGALVLLAAFAFGSALASADTPDPPGYDGGMTFQQIRGPSDPEEFSWKVSLGEDQELVPIDDRHAVVYYEGREHTAFGIYAEPAHDAEGSTVPTTLIVSEGDIVTLVVHHRAGNPAAGGASFVYPVTAGAGWEGGFHTEYMDIPDELSEEGVSPAPLECIVPRVAGQSLKAARRNLNRANCKLGNISGRRSRAVRVVKQYRHPGALLAVGTEVGVKVGTQ